MSTQVEKLEAMLAVLEQSPVRGVLASNSLIKKVGKHYEVWAGVLLFKGTFSEVESYINEEIYKHSLQFDM